MILLSEYLMIFGLSDETLLTNSISSIGIDLFYINCLRLFTIYYWEIIL